MGPESRAAAAAAAVTPPRITSRRNAWIRRRWAPNSQRSPATTCSVDWFRLQPDYPQTKLVWLPAEWGSQAVVSVGR